MSTKIAYNEKLKDPRWQKKRLEILSRDQFTCQFCGDTESTLNVHHLSYSKDPWDTDNDHLLSLCESCHEVEYKNRPKAEQSILLSIRKRGFSSSDVDRLSDSFSNLEIVHAPEVMASVIEWTFGNRELMIHLKDLFFENLRQKSNKNKFKELMF